MSETWFVDLLWCLHSTYEIWVSIWVGLVIDSELPRDGGWTGKRRSGKRYGSQKPESKVGVWTSLFGLKQVRGNHNTNITFTTDGPKTPRGVEENWYEHHLSRRGNIFRLLGYLGYFSEDRRVDLSGPGGIKQKVPSRVTGIVSGHETPGPRNRTVYTCTIRNVTWIRTP